MDIKKEKELVQQAKESLEAFDKLYEYYLPKIYSYIYNRCRNKQLTEDVSSRTFVKAMTKLKSFEFKGYRFGSWLYKIAHNELIDSFRKNKDLFDIEEVQVSSDKETSKLAENEERKRIVLKAMSELPEQYQQVLSLKYFEEMSNKEMADIVGCKKATLAVKLHRSLKAFEQVMKKEDLLKFISLG